MFLLIHMILFVTCANSMLVETQSGPVIGSEVYLDGQLVKRYLGIPYAEPPLDKLRFKKTVPVKPWSDPYMATTFKPSCMQYYPFDYPWVDHMPEKSENCLHLNIWVPGNAFQNSTKSVMIWIHGGGLTTGSNRLPVYDGHVLAAEGDVIIITVNYRLGIFGFLSTSSEDAPGNMGLYDVLEALKWVNENIGAFGGNPKSITVFGESAGSTIIGHLIVSPLSRGLFQRIIMQSAAPNPGHHDIKKHNSLLGQKVAAALDCASESTTIENNPREVVRCLESKKADDLIKAVSSITKTSPISFRPVYGNEILPMYPFDALLTNHIQPINVMIGCVRDEGSFPLIAKFIEIFGPYGENNTKISKTLGKEIISKTFRGIANGDEIADYYLNNLKDDDYDIIRRQAYHAYGDYALFCPVLYYARKLSYSGGNVYYYYFNHQSANTVFAPWMGVTHFIEVPLVFGRPLDNTLDYSEDEKKLSKNMMELWTTFAKNGYPSSTWQKFSDPKYYTEHIQTNDSYENNFLDHINNCEFLSKYLFD